MPELNREDIIKALECFHTRILNTKLAEKITETEIMAIINALTLIKQLTEEKREIFEEIEKCFFEELVVCTEAKVLDEEMFADLKKKYIGE